MKNYRHTLVRHRHNLELSVAHCALLACLSGSLFACSDTSSDSASGGSAGVSGGGAGGTSGSAAGGSTQGGTAGSAAGSSSTGGTGASAGSAGTNATGGTGASAGSSGSAGTGGVGGAASDFVPYFFDDFDSYTNGESLSGKAFDAAGRTTASDEEAFSGSQSARMAIASGDQGGFGQWGGIVPIDPPLGRGKEVWTRLRVMWPSSFTFSASPWMKFLRLHNARQDGTNGGYNDLYVDQADSTTSVLRTIKEVHDVWAVYDGPSLPRDQWESYEMYLFIDHESVDAGGNARVRIWRNNTLIFDRTDVPTLTDAGGHIDAFYLFTYWNNELPPDNHCYVDDLVIADDRSPPPNRDAAGHAFVGDWAPN